MQQRPCPCGGLRSLSTQERPGLQAAQALKQQQRNYTEWRNGILHTSNYTSNYTYYTQVYRILQNEIIGYRSLTGVSWHQTRPAVDQARSL